MSFQDIKNQNTTKNTGSGQNSSKTISPTILY